MNTNVNFVQSYIADIDAALKNLDKQREGLLMIKSTAQSVLNAPSHNWNGSAPKSQSGVSTGFRDAIRQALRSRPQGLTGKELVEELKSSGELAKYRGKVPPSVRVHNELYGLGQKGEVIKDKKDRRYRMKDTRQ